jgi:tRNA-Thr(GGU) m(6)t(6)A37 methyltransferase TsaA
MFTLSPIGFIESPYKESSEIPKGLGVRHDAEGTLHLLPEFEVGLTDIEGFSHLFVIWAFDRSTGFDLVGRTPADDRPHGVFATRSPRRPNPIGLTVVDLLGGNMNDSTCEEWTCSTARQSWISSRIFPASRRRSCAGDGWRKPRRGRAEAREHGWPCVRS